ncbi:cytochrome P450 [Rhizophagus irregularis]|uniref:Cytochrome P450 n=1 Tax=Rhizophagus irregularis TaxID=588596 RepID=A0A2I1FYN1_9GLOM|nr:cytochrome P450 [Rhizophagus irregularis]
MYLITEICLSLIGLLIYLIIKYPDRSIATRSRPDINGNKGYPLIGNLISVLNNDVVLLMHCTLMEYGPVSTYTIPVLGRQITVNSPELLEHVMKRTIFSKIVYDVLGDGIFNADGEMWKFQRRLASHLFRGQNFRDVICVVFEEETKILINILQEAAKKGDVIDLQDIFFRFTLDSFGKITFETDFGSLTNPNEPVQFAEAFDFVQTMIDKRFINPIWPITELLTKDGAKMRYSCKYLSNYAYNIVKKRRDNEGSLKNNDILSMFMNAEINDENGNMRKLSDKELRDIVLNLLIAGRDTTAQAISWMMYNIMVHPDVEEKLIKEANSSENLIPSYDEIKKFKYAHAVFHETLRLHPSVPKNNKLCIKDDVLPNGIPIHAGEWVSWSSWAMGRDERIWGKDAQKFIPDRFLENERPNQYKFNSFNCGPRICLGQNFATVEALTVATTILKQFKFELLPGQKSPPDFAQSITLRMKNPLLVKVHFRQ